MGGRQFARRRDEDQQPGADQLLFSSGTTTRVTAVRRLPPRMRTASSISGLIERMAAEALAKAIGRKRVVKARMRIQAVP
jgi:hypothetical protein